MGNRTYYGEYSLLRWMELLITENIVLPEYQRHFVWNEKDLDRLIRSIKEGQFIQPVTIGLYPLSAGNQVNLLLDGQQRLTSILLAYLGYFPNKSKFESASNQTATEDESAFDDQDTSNSDEEKTKPIKWTVKELLDKASNKSFQPFHERIQAMRSQLSGDDKYEPLDRTITAALTDAFCEKHFIGFSYIVPNVRAADDVQKYFTRLFRNMNYYGQKLSPAESRKSLYYQDPRYTKYFEGRTNSDEYVLCDLKVAQGAVPGPIDFIRYLAILAQKKGDPRRKVLLGYARYDSRENFYADYVAHILGLEQEDRVDKFDGYLPSFEDIDTIVRNTYPKLRANIQVIQPLIPPLNIKDKPEPLLNTFGSWGEADYWLFGLIYHIVFEQKELTQDENSLQALKGEITNKTSGSGSSSANRSNRVTNVRTRLEESIEIYSRYVS